ncbi:hypothetical protein BGZ76_007815 [Entomortierella beljakovae]|nr:hypothetical protein BGZ76_007815 [Entomortierella beljakovae]
MKVVLPTALILALLAAVSATPFTAPITKIKTGVKISAESLTKRYAHRKANSLRKRAIALRMGTPPQIFNVAIDTGSYATWLNSNLCTSDTCKKTNRFDCEASETCYASTTPFKLQYVDGTSVSGYYIEDNYSVGSLKFDAVLGVVIENKDDYTPGIDGTMGLWYYPDEVEVPILNVLAQSKILSQHMIAIWLDKALTSDEIYNTPGGEITFGGLNPDRYVGEITYINNIEDEVWTIPIDGMQVGSTVIDIGNAEAIIDTGTTGMLLPKTVADSINSIFPGAYTSDKAGDNWIIPCTGNITTSITFGGFVINIPYEYMAIQSALTADGYCLSAALFAYGDTATIDQWLIGNVVLANVYTIFDFGTHAVTGGRIGFATLAPNMTSINLGNNVTDGENGGNGGNLGDFNSAASLIPPTSTLLLQAATVIVGVISAESLTKRYIHKRELHLSGLHKRATVSPLLTSLSNDLCYTVPIQVGTPPQSFNVMIDTGSFATWVNSNLCTSPVCLASNQYNCDKSSTCTPSATPFTVKYVDGSSVAGTYIVDTYNIGSLKFNGALGAVTTNSETHSTPGLDGIMGLWYYPETVQVPILNVLAQTGALTQKMIGVWLQKTSTTGKDIASAPGGEITFGGTNPARYTGPITYVNNIPQTVWTIQVGGMKVGNKVINVGNATASIDTGTTAMLVPKTVADEINGAIPGAITLAEVGGNWLLPCSGNTPVSITFGEFTINIPYKSLAMQTQTTTDGKYCLSAAMFPFGDIATIDQWLIGDVVLSNAYTVFDFGTNTANGGRIGFAALVNSGANPNTGGSAGGSDGGSDGGGISVEPNGGLSRNAATSTLLLQAVVTVMISVIFAMH